MLQHQFNELIKTIKDYAAPTQIPQFQFDELIKTIKKIEPAPTPRTSMWFTEVLLFIIMIILVVG